MVRQVKAAQTAAVTCHDGEQCHTFETMRENIGNTMPTIRRQATIVSAMKAIIRYSTVMTGRRCERANSASKAMETSGRRKHVKATMAMSANVPNK